MWTRSHSKEQSWAAPQMWLTWKPLIFPHSPWVAIYLWVCVDFWVLLGTQEWEEEEAVTTSQAEFPPVCHGHGQVYHDLSGDEGRSREPEALTQRAVCTGRVQEGSAAQMPPPALILQRKVRRLREGA